MRFDHLGERGEEAAATVRRQLTELCGLVSDIPDDGWPRVTASVTCKYTVSNKDSIARRLLWMFLPR